MRKVLAVLTALLLTAPMLAASGARAEAPADDAWTPAEDWAWAQIASGRTANFDDAACHAPTVGVAADAAVWNDKCRAVRGVVLEQMLTRLPWRREIPHQGVRLVGARIDGDIDLSNAHLHAAVVLKRSHVDGNIKLALAQLDSLFALDGSVVKGNIDAQGLESDSNVSFADGRLLTDIDTAIQGTTILRAVNLKNARIKGSLYLNGGIFSKQTFVLQRAHIDEEVQTSGARFDGLVFAGGMRIGVLTINATVFNGGALFSGSTVDGVLDASSSSFGGAGLGLSDVHVSTTVYLSHLIAATKLNLSGARLGGGVTLEGSNIQGPFAADNAQIVGDLVLDKDGRFGKAFSLTGARVDGSVKMQGVPFTGAVDFGNAHVLGDVDLGNARFADDLGLAALRVDGDARLGGVVVAGGLTGSGMEVGRDLALNKAATIHGAANLFGTHVANSVHMEQAVFDRGLEASNLRVGDDLLLNDANFGGPVMLGGAHVGGDLVLRGVRLGVLDLSGADIEGTLAVDDATIWRPPETTRDSAGRTLAAPQLSLVNARVGGLQDANVPTEACPTHKQPPQHRNGWPTWQSIQLDGFAYGHLGSNAAGAGDMQHRDACWWRWWLDRNPVFSSQPYVELAAVMSAHGDQDSAARILYYGRVRETEVAWQNGEYLRWLLLAGLDVFAGFGIGTYTFYALAWILALTAIGVLLLRRSPGGTKHTIWWQIGASLTRLLPGVELNKEFSDFFDDPGRKRLRGWHVFVFSSFVVIGWVLGLFLVAAMSGLTQHS